MLAIHSLPGKYGILGKDSLETKYAKAFTVHHDGNFYIHAKGYYQGDDGTTAPKYDPKRIKHVALFKDHDLSEFVNIKTLQILYPATKITLPHENVLLIISEQVDSKVINQSGARYLHLQCHTSTVKGLDLRLRSLAFVNSHDEDVIVDAVERCKPQSLRLNFWSDTLIVRLDFSDVEEMRGITVDVRTNKSTTT